MMLRWMLTNWVRQAAQQQLHNVVADAVRGERDGDEGGDQPPAPCEIAFILASSIEAGGLVDLLQQAVTTRCQSHTEHAGFLEGRYVIVAESGIGQPAAAATTQAVLSLHHPKWVVSAGFAGALDEALRRGHILMPDEVVDADGQRLALGLSAESSRGLHVGRLLTVDHLIRTRQDKEALAAEHQAIACDMETLAVAQACAEVKTRFMSVRVITDTLDDELPKEIESLLDQKSLAGKLGAATGAIFKRPSSVKDMWKLKEDALKATDRLARFLVGVVDQLSPQ